MGPEDLVENLIENEKVNVNRMDTVESFLDIGIPVKRSKETECSGVAVKRAKASECNIPNEIVTISSRSNEDLNENEVLKRIGQESIKTESKPKDSLANIHSLDELRYFLDTETKTRKISRKTCLTSTLNQEQWKTLRKAVLQGLNEKTPNKSLKQSRKIIRDALVKFSL